MIYLDNAASTAIHEEVLQEMLPFFKEYYGNPSSIHKLGRITFKAIQTARKQVANLINSKPEEIFFTSGGTESNNTALFGINKKKGNHIITSSIEHDAILEPCKKLKQDGFNITYLPVDNKGLINPIDLQNAMSNDTCLVSIMYSNNEVGTIQPIGELANICKKNHIPFHTDAIQAVGKIPIDVQKIDVDMLSLSSHKINGPKGVGALFVRTGVDMIPFVFGGGQENGLRSGTENVANIVGFGKSCDITFSNLERNVLHMRNLRDLLVSKILSEIPQVILNGHDKKRLPNNAHLTFMGVNGEDLIIKLDENGIAASTGSACSVKIQKASHVLQAMGFSHEQINGSLRLTLGLFNNENEINETVEVLKKVVCELRAVSPYKTKYDF